MNVSRSFRLVALVAGLTLAVARVSLHAALPTWDFTDAAEAATWTSAKDITARALSTEGLVLTLGGADPILLGPAQDYPAGQLLWARIRLKSETGGNGQLFYFGPGGGATESHSVSFSVPAGRWVEVRVPLPALGVGGRLRLDPPGTRGELTLGSVGFEERGALPDFDFATIPDAGQWMAQHDCRLGTPVPDEGLPVTITGADPYFAGPLRNFPTGQALWLNLRLKSTSGGNAQVFFYNTGPQEANSVRFVVPAGDWFTARVPLPALGANFRFRIDPPGDAGTCVLSRLTFEPRVLLTPPAWPQPVPPLLGADSIKVRSGGLELVQGPGFGAFELRVDGTNFAISNTRALLGYLNGAAARWLNLSNTASVERIGDGVRVTLAVPDADGGNWQLAQTFQPTARPGGIDVETRVSVDRDRRVVFLPLLTVLPGVGTFGTNKTQGLVAGVEYLENEASSSERDLIGPQARRQVPDSLKLAFPLMALAADGRWAGLTWEPSPQFCALFDGPDRIFHSGGSAMAILFPGSDPARREDGSVLPYDGEWLKSGEPLVLRATLLGGRGGNVVPAVEEYVARRGLPPLPDPGYSATEYFTLAAKGWLDSEIRDGNHFRHAVGPTFGSQPAADAALYMDWLAAQVPDFTLANRLTQQAAASLGTVGVAGRNSAQVGHVRYPLPALVYGGAAENAAAALAEGRQLLTRFQPDGSVRFVPTPGGVDLGSTHWSKEANGLAATSVALVLERGIFSGDRALITEGLRLLRALDKFRGTVPRGAQTWEVPLHTPDILASAYLVRAYTLGYELTGDADFLAQARYWAWTGVPFIYLSPPNDQPVGVYSTTPVFGATQFIAPNWIGLPVQWCGLVYADALRRFAAYDPIGPWITLADGIARAGIQHTHTAAEPRYQGLLPDSYDLRAQFRNPVPINPATLLPLALQAYGEPAVYDFHSFRRHGLLVHAPGALTAIREDNDGVSFRAGGWPRRPWQLVVNGLTRKPRVKLDGRETIVGAPHSFDAATGRLILQLTRPAGVEILTVALDGVNIRHDPATGLVLLTWPAALNHFTLETTPSVEPSVWRPIRGPFDLRENQRVFATAATEPAELFRLNWEPW